MTPIAESLIADAFGQAIREVLYEDELEAMARQQRTLYLRRAIEEIDKQRLEHEDERLNKVMVSIRPVAYSIVLCPADTPHSVSVY